MTRPMMIVVVAAAFLAAPAHAFNINVMTTNQEGQKISEAYDAGTWRRIGDHALMNDPDVIVFCQQESAPDADRRTMADQIIDQGQLPGFTATAGPRLCGRIYAYEGSFSRNVCTQVSVAVFDDSPYTIQTDATPPHAETKKTAKGPKGAAYLRIDVNDARGVPAAYTVGCSHLNTDSPTGDLRKVVKYMQPPESHKDGKNLQYWIDGLRMMERGGAAVDGHYIITGDLNNRKTWPLQTVTTAALPPASRACANVPTRDDRYKRLQLYSTQANSGSKEGTGNAVNDARAFEDVQVLQICYPEVFMGSDGLRVGDNGPFTNVDAFECDTSDEDGSLTTYKNTCKAAEYEAHVLGPHAAAGCNCEEAVMAAIDDPNAHCLLKPHGPDGTKWTKHGGYQGGHLDRVCFTSNAGASYPLQHLGTAVMADTADAGVADHIGVVVSLTKEDGETESDESEYTEDLEEHPHASIAKLEQDLAALVGPNQW